MRGKTACSAVWAERWDEEADCADGLCHCLGEAASIEEGERLLAGGARMARVFGWPGRGYLTDAGGRRLGGVAAIFGN